jgi:hypothetical protein
MEKNWTRASDMAGAPSVLGGSMLVGGAETVVTSRNTNLEPGDQGQHHPPPITHSC